ncbi:MAG: hypothetical protein RL067_279 [Verrucomicrobiota bacterium]|jgi:uncharacterized protein YndB with AHSA1/START domain|nr:hypothetical protein [Verrucomicrobiota bacterium]
MSESRFSLRKQMHLGVGLGILYGLFCRVLFHGADEWVRQAFGRTGVALLGIMSISFLFLVPAALGFIVIWFEREERRWARMLFGPWVSAVIMTLCTVALQLEGWICVIMALPVILFMASLGGVVAGFARPKVQTDGGRRLCVAAVALLPFVAGPLESLRARSNELRTVACSIDIAATPAQVWRQIRSVPRITEAEHTFSWHHRVGFPRPTEAVLEGTGVGSVRYARFEGDLLFVEKVTEWDENRRLSFSIKADTANIPPTTLDEHVIIGGPYFDVLHGTYWIEPLGPDRVRLHLASDQRLATGFNAYAAWWTEWVMADLQDYILRIVKARAERDR